MSACGYVNCTCRDCFDIAVCSRPLGEPHLTEHHLCLECEEAGCNPDGDGECQREPEPEEEE